MAIWPFIFARKDKVLSDKNINHEKIHLEQQKELMIIGLIASIIMIVLFGFSPWIILAGMPLFYYVYLANFIWEIIKIPFEDKKLYMDIWFEKEAYDNDDNLQYLETRKRFAWIKYL